MLDMMQFCSEGTLCENFLQSCQDGVRVYELSAHNGNVSSEVKEFFGDPSTSVEALEAVCGDGSLQNIHKCTSKNCLLSKYIFRPGDNVVSTLQLSLYKQGWLSSQLHVILLMPSGFLLAQPVTYNMQVKQFIN